MEKDERRLNPQKMVRIKSKRGCLQRLVLELGQRCSQIEDITHVDRASNGQMGHVFQLNKEYWRTKKKDPTPFGSLLSFILSNHSRLHHSSFMHALFSFSFSLAFAKSFVWASLLLQSGPDKSWPVFVICPRIQVSRKYYVL